MRTCLVILWRQIMQQVASQSDNLCWKYFQRRGEGTCSWKTSLCGRAFTAISKSILTKAFCNLLSSNSDVEWNEERMMGRTAGWGEKWNHVALHMVLCRNYKYNAMEWDIVEHGTYLKTKQKHSRAIQGYNRNGSWKGIAHANGSHEVFRI